MRIAVLMGGVSSEREISLKTGKAVLKALKNEKYDAFPIELNKENMITALQEADFDLAFIALHGEYGEDGRVQAVLDILGKKYTGSGFIASAVAIDKEITKKLLISDNILMPKTFEKIENIGNYPVIIKPATEGSSIGLYVCNDQNDANEAAKALKGQKILIEEYIKGDELTVGVLEGEALGVLKIKPKSGLYDYKSKYTKGQTEFEVPAKIPEKIYDEAMNISEKIYKILNLKGGIRVDMMLQDDKLYFLEVNTVPGMTDTSLLPRLASLKGYSFEGFVKKIVEKFAK
jgi:D-alanine-D-alanine ligase